MDDTTCKQSLVEVLGQEATEKTYTSETWCALLPCPGPGAYMALLQATDRGMPSNALTFGIGVDPTCALVPYDQALQAALPPTAAEAQAPTPPAPPPVTLPP